MLIAAIALVQLRHDFAQRVGRLGPEGIERNLSISTRPLMLPKVLAGNKPVAVIEYRVKAKPDANLTAREFNYSFKGDHDKFYAALAKECASWYESGHKNGGPHHDTFEPTGVYRSLHGGLVSNQSVEVLRARFIREDKARQKYRIYWDQKGWIAVTYDETYPPTSRHSNRPS
jgi:hypothetical protein